MSKKIEKLHQNGKSGKKVYLENKYVYKEKTANFKNMEIICKLLQKKFSLILCDLKSEGNFYSYKFTKGFLLESIDDMSIASIIQVLKFIKKMQKIGKNDNKVIVHGDLSPVNVIFTNKKMKKIKAVIDWDRVSWGNIYQDVAYVCWLWVNFGNQKQENNHYITKIIKIIKFMNYQKNEVKILRKEIIININSERERNLAIKNDQELDKWYLYCLNWINNFWGEIENELKLNHKFE